MPESYIEVIVGFSEGNEFLGRVVWNSYEEIVDWEEIEVPIPFDGGTSKYSNQYGFSEWSYRWLSS